MLVGITLKIQLPFSGHIFFRTPCILQCFSFYVSGGKTLNGGRRRHGGGSGGGGGGGGRNSTTYGSTLSTFSSFKDFLKNKAALKGLGLIAGFVVIFICLVCCCVQKCRKKRGENAGDIESSLKREIKEDSGGPNKWRKAVSYEGVIILG